MAKEKTVVQRFLELVHEELVHDRIEVVLDLQKTTYAFIFRGVLVSLWIGYDADTCRFSHSGALDGVLINQCDHVKLQKLVEEVHSSAVFAYIRRRTRPSHSIESLLEEKLAALLGE